MRLAAAATLPGLGATAPEVTSALGDALRDPHPGVRAAAAGGLGSLGDSARSLRPQLRVAADTDPAAEVRRTASYSLKVISP